MKTAPSQQYGQRVAQERAQQAVPLAGATNPGPSAPPSGGGAPAMPAGPLPGQLTPLSAPTQRPDEPLTAGMAMGAGPGPEVLGDLAGEGEDVGMVLRAIYSRFPNEHLRAMLEALDED